MTTKILRYAGALAIVAVLASGTMASAQGYSDAAWCAQHYRSYNPATGMYMGYDGRLHACGNSFRNALGYAPAEPYPYAAPLGQGRPPGILPRDRAASPPRGNPDRTFQNATDQPF